jgi:hypothetical protein
MERFPYSAHEMARMTWKAAFAIVVLGGIAIWVAIGAPM